MGSVIFRGLYSVDYGSVETVGSGVVLGDNNDSTFKRYFEDSGSIQVHGPFTGVGVPGGRDIIAVRCGLRQRNTGFAGLYNGWVMGFLRINNKRQNVTKAYQQDGYIDGGREILGPPLYKKDFVPWTNDEISTMATEVGAATGDIGPSGNRWCVCSEAYVRVVYDDDVPVPDTPYPANGQTISTSSVNFGAELPAPQSEQPVRAIFQVCRVNTFDDDTLKTFIGGLNSDTVATSRSYYVSEIGKASYTDLGPGVWYLRMKGRDYRGEEHESAWGATTSFTITHGALPVPSLSAPAPSSISPTPYGTRSAVFTTAPSGDRYVGAGWRFSQSSDFSSGVIEWTNNKDGLFYTASAIQPATISYNPQPDPEVAPGLNGSKVSFEDQSQYLSQATTWYAQVRAVDKYGQAGDWSSNYTFTVSHPPVVASPIPSLGQAFDKLTDPVTWTFTDPWAGDQQSAYRMRVYDGSMNLLQDTGKVLQQVAQATMDFPNHLEETLSYKLEIWDLDDVISAESNNTFRLSTSPVVTVPYPEPDEAIISGQPVITWSVVFATGSITQQSYRIKFTQRNNGNVVFDTGTVVSTATSYTPPRAILKNLIGYQMQVTIVDSQGLDGMVTRNFSTNFIRPDAFFTEIDGSNYQEDGYVLVRWPDAVPDGFFAEWRIYRRVLGEVEWEYVATSEDVDARSYKDWTVAGSDYFEYAVTQVAYRFGSLVESEFDENGPNIRVYSDTYWLIDPTDETNNFRISSVNGDKFANRQQTNELVILGGGLRVNYGTYIGRQGSLAVAVRDNIRYTGSEIMKKLNTLFRMKRWLLLRDPFGGVTKISIGEVAFARMPGVGNAEYGDMDIPYSEVGAEQ